MVYHFQIGKSNNPVVIDDDSDSDDTTTTSASASSKPVRPSVKGTRRKTLPTGMKLPNQSMHQDVINLVSDEESEADKPASRDVASADAHINDVPSDSAQGLKPTPNANVKEEPVKESTERDGFDDIPNVDFPSMEVDDFPYSSGDFDGIAGIEAGVNDVQLNDTDDVTPDGPEAIPPPSSALPSSDCQTTEPEANSDSGDINMDEVHLSDDAEVDDLLGPPSSPMKENTKCRITESSSLPGEPRNLNPPPVLNMFGFYKATGVPSEAKGSRKTSATPGPIESSTKISSETVTKAPDISSVSNEQAFDSDMAQAEDGEQTIEWDDSPTSPMDRSQSRIKTRLSSSKSPPRQVDIPEPVPPRRLPAGERLQEELGTGATMLATETQRGCDMEEDTEKVPETPARQISEDRQDNKSPDHTKISPGKSSGERLKAIQEAMRSAKMAVALLPILGEGRSSASPSKGKSFTCICPLYSIPNYVPWMRPLFY